MKRRASWPEDLSNYIESRRFTPFSWGLNDCAFFVVGGELAMSGTDLAKGWPRYSTERGALRILKRVGGMRGLAEKSGLREKRAEFAQRGDIVLVPLDGLDTFGLVAGSGYWCAPGASGLVFRPISEVRVVFEV